MISKAITLGQNYVRRNAMNNITSDCNMKNSEILHEQHLMANKVNSTSTLNNSFNKKINYVKNYDDRYNNLSEKVLTEALYQIYNQSLPLDDDFKETYKENIKHVVNEKVCKLIQESGSASNFMNDISSKSDFLNILVEKVKEKIDEKVDEDVKKGKDIKKPKNKFGKKSKDDAEDPDSKDDTTDDKKKTKSLKEEDDSDIDDYDDEDDEDLGIDLKSIDINEACDIIKDKVIKVVSEEEEESLKQQEILEDIKNAKSLGESVHFKTNTNLVNNSLFKNLMITSYKEVLSESVKGSENVYSYKIDDKIKVDMDMILVESIMKYTLLETFYTLKIKDYDKNDLVRLSESM